MNQNWLLISLTVLAIGVTLSFLAYFKGRVSDGFVVCSLLVSGFFFYLTNFFMDVPPSNECFLFLVSVSACIASTVHFFWVTKRTYEQEERPEIIYEWEVPPQKK